MTKLFKHIAFSLLAIALLTGCEDGKKERFNFVTFETSKSILVPAGEEVSTSIKVYGSKNAGSDMTFDIQILESSTLDPQAYTLPSSVTIPGGSNEGTIPFTVKDMDIDPDKYLDLQITSSDSNILIGDPISIGVGLKCPKLEIDFDNWGSETSVEIKNAADEVVYSFPAGTYADGTDKMSVTLCQLTPGNYTFTINDLFGDGFTAPSGSYKMTLAEEVYFFNADFDSASETHQFTVNP